MRSGLVNTGSGDGGPIDVFSVFDSFTVTGNGFGPGAARGSTGERSALHSGTRTAGAAERTSTKSHKILLTESGSAREPGLVQSMSLAATTTTSAVDEVLGVLEDASSRGLDRRPGIRADLIRCAQRTGEWCA